MPVPAITKKALAASMKELMEKIPFAKISVGSICQKCGMSRKSFYYHFKDKYELVNWIFYTEFISFLAQRNYTDEREEFLYNMCLYFHENKKFYSNAFDVEGQNSFTEFFSEIIQFIAYEYIQDFECDNEFCDFYSTFLANAFSFSIMKWLKESTPMEPERFASFLDQSLMGLPQKKDE